ncbi:sulfate transporter-like [Mytilus californianus]|uniref:sulfate transporter-like n=1 Tax=Mytilus californianus TaxID=6549 RepID=UPI00224500BD|nr:sulfate transporter-like [Mytilus californianus]XP_052064185.1 sulfate transporter-like [Mytilus californianus]XP_052064186.1 sulfate transporter-like [Mytilus californianus]XP_052064187.1 sulfate transporter-like [Mytilus californianus]
MIINGGEMSSDVVQLSRSLKTQSELYDFYGKPKRSSRSFSENIKNKCSLSKLCAFLLALFPVINVIRTYKVRNYILDDIISGLSVACLHFPQGLAFGILASLSPAYGLYTSFFPVLLYVIFGTSQHVSFGTNAVIAIFTAELVESQLEQFDLHGHHQAVNGSMVNNITTVSPRMDNAVLDYKVSVAAGSSFIVGLLLLIMGLCRMGFITSYLSSSFIAAFTTTGAIHIISSQVPNALGITIQPVNKPGKLIYVYIEIFKAFPKIHVATLLVSIICLIILVLVKDVINERFKNKMKMPIPIDIILVVIATIISYFAKLHDTFDVGVVGEIPAGLPTPQLPRVSVDIIGHSIVVGLIVFVLTISMARLCEVKHGYSVNDNQELVAYGIANLGGSFFSCFPACVAPPRTVVLSTMGAKTTLNGIVSAIFVLLVIMFIGKYLESAPKAVLAVMIIVAVKNLLYQFKELPKLWRVNRYDFVIFVGTVLCGVLIDFPYALYVGVLLCLLTVVVQSQNSSSYTIRKVEQEDRLLEQKNHDVPLCNSTIAIFRMESSLYFATADQFIKELYKATFNPKAYRKLQDKKLNTNAEININQSENSGNNDERMSLSKTNHENEIPVVPLTHIIIDCSSMNYIDMNGMKALIQINSEYKQVGVNVMFGNCTNFMKTFTEKSDLSEAIDMKNVYADILDAYFAATHKK